MLSMQDWFDQFQAQNGRIPTQQEFADAKARGEFFSDSDPVSGQGSSWQAHEAAKGQVSGPIPQHQEPATSDSEHEASDAGVTYPFTFKKLIIGFVGLFVALLLLIGAGALVRYQTGDIRGVWQLEKVDGKSFSDEFTQGIKKGERHNSYVLIDKKQHLDLITQLDLSDLRVGQPDISVYDYVKDAFKVDRWKRSVDPALTEEDFEYKVGLKFDEEISHFFSQDGSNKSAVLQNLIDSYKPYTDKEKHYTIRYSVDVDRLTLATYDKDNKVVGKRTYKRLSDKKAKAVTKALDQERQEFKDRYE